MSAHRTFVARGDMRLGMDDRGASDEWTLVVPYHDNPRGIFGLFADQRGTKRGPKGDQRYVLDICPGIPWGMSGNSFLALRSWTYPKDSWTYVQEVLGYVHCAIPVKTIIPVKTTSR